MFKRAAVCSLILVAACSSKAPAPSTSSSEPLSNKVPADAAAPEAITPPTGTAESGGGGAGASSTSLKLTGLEPAVGDFEGGTYVVIKGEGFLKDGPRNAKVYFGSAQGSVVRFQSDRELIVQAPGGKANQTVDVLVVFDPGGEIKAPNAFKFVDKAP
jgi:hypothetical protein